MTLGQNTTQVLVKVKPVLRWYDIDLGSILTW